MTNLSDTLAALKPCPFCGEPAALIVHVPIKRHRYYVRCVIDKCGARTCSSGSEAEAIAAWNTRTGQLVPVPSVESVARAIHEAGSDIPWEVTSQQDIAFNRARAVIAAMQSDQP